MKKILFVSFSTLLFSCGGGNKNNEQSKTVDSNSVNNLSTQNDTGSQNTNSQIQQNVDTVKYLLPIDVMSDNELIGKSIKIRGFYIHSGGPGDMDFLYDDLGSFNSISVDVTSLDKTVKKNLFQNCAGRGGYIKFQGIVIKDVGGLIKLKVKQIL